MIAFYLLFLLSGKAFAQTLEKIGDVFPIQFRSNGNSDILKTDTPLGRSYVLTHPGATYIALHFAELNLLTGDIIEVSDANGGQAYTLTGTGKGNGSVFWSQHIKGDSVVLNMLSTSMTLNSIFAIDEYAAGFENLSETICGSDSKENAACYTSSFPTEYSKSRAVARLLINGSNHCTGFLVSGSNHFLTNHHCIKNAADALNTDYEFMSEAPSCASSNSQLAHKGMLFDGAVFIKTSAELDYTLVQLSNGNPASLYGFLELDNQPAVSGGQIYIPQNPGGKAKQLAIFSSHAADASDGFCHINNVGNTGCGESAGINLFYFCDTEGGSSGSPVISRSTNKALGLHKCGGCTNGNHAVSSETLWSEFGSIITPPPVPSPLAASTPIITPTPLPVPSPVAAPTLIATPIPPTVPTPVAAPTPIVIPAPPPVPSPLAAPTPASPVTRPTVTKPVCLISGARCSGPSKCCSGVCRINRKCR